MILEWQNCLLQHAFLSRETMLFWPQKRGIRVWYRTHYESSRDDFVSVGVDVMQLSEPSKFWWLLLFKLVVQGILICRNSFG